MENIDWAKNPGTGSLNLLEGPSVCLEHLSLKHVSKTGPECEVKSWKILQLAVAGATFTYG